VITEFVIRMVGGIVTGLFSIIPAWSVDDSSMHTMDGVGLGVASLNGWVPEQLAVTLLLLILGVRLFFLAWTGVLFLYRLIPFNG
jgi:hypothetical protein